MDLKVLTLSLGDPSDSYLMCAEGRVSRYPRSVGAVLKAFPRAFTNTTVACERSSDPTPVLLALVSMGL